MSTAIQRDDAGARGRVLLSREFASRSYAIGSTTVLVVTGEVDFEAVHRFALAIEASARSSPALMVLDTEELTFIDSRGLGAIGSARNRLRARSGDLVIRNASAMLKRLLGIVGLATLLEAA
jgi:anti-anti-sigma factor